MESKKRNLFKEIESVFKHLQQERENKTLTSKIFELSAPYNNQYQGAGERLLFVCSAGLLRSPTAADVATKMGYNARSCGSSNYALIPLSVNLICWSSVIIFMNNENFDEAVKSFSCVDYDEGIKNKAVVWDIPDNFERNNSTLVSLIEEKLKQMEDSYEKKNT